jgi:hypothetical protein
MDDAAIGVGLAATPMVAFFSVRNASDPVMKDKSREQDKEASSIYKRYGYFTTIGSVLVVWGLIAGMS